MLSGVYAYSGRRAVELPIYRNIAALVGEDETWDKGPLAIAGRSRMEQAEHDGVTCLFSGVLRERESLACDLGVIDAPDADLVLRGHHRHGEDLLRTLRGEYLLVIWDERRGAGVVSCDLLSVHPLYLAAGGGYFAFATELPDLLSVLPARPAPDRDAFLSWLGGWTLPSGNTFYEGVSRLMPGQLVELGNGAVKKRTYWRPTYSGTSSASRDELSAGLRDHLDRAVGQRLSTQSSGVVLSGGLDSSIVAASAAHEAPPGSAVRTYSAVFPGKGYDEAWKVESLTGALGIEPDMFNLKPQGGLWEGLNYLKRRAEPLGSNSVTIDLAMVDQATTDGTRVVMEGHTGDELFGASPWVLADQLRSGRLFDALRIARRWPGRQMSARDIAFVFKQFGLKGLPPHSLHRLARERRNPASIAPVWFLPEHRPRFSSLRDQWAWKDGPDGPRWWQYQADVLVYAPHREGRLDYLRNRATNAGIESETPFYDPDLIEYCLRVPPDLMFHPDFTRPIAREAMRGRIPDDVRLNNIKAAFSPFCFDMLTGADAPGIERLLTDRNAELGSYVDMEQVRRMWSDDRPNWAPGYKTMHWGTDIWRFADAECWLRSQSNPDFADEMLAQSDIPAPDVRRVSRSGV